MLASLSKVYRPAFIAARQSRSASLLERGSVRMSATAAAQAVDPKAGAILNYWFGDDWATQSRYHGDQSSFGKWFKGSAEMDKTQTQSEKQNQSLLPTFWNLSRCRTRQCMGLFETPGLQLVARARLCAYTRVRPSPKVRSSCSPCCPLLAAASLPY
eukprot:gene12232-15370_t